MELCVRVVVIKFVVYWFFAYDLKNRNVRNVELCVRVIKFVVYWFFAYDLKNLSVIAVEPSLSECIT